jgi:hypothetical protein
MTGTVLNYQVFDTGMVSYFWLTFNLEPDPEPEVRDGKQVGTDLGTDIC